MASVEMGSIYHYQPLTAGRGRDGSKKPSGRLQDYNPIEFLDITGPTPEERQRTGSSDGQATGGSEGNSEPTAERDRNSAASPRSSEGEHQEESVVVGDTLAEDRNTQDTQQEAGGGDQEREGVHLDQSIVPYNTDSENDSDAYEVVRNQQPPQFKHPSILRPCVKNRASSTRNKPGSPGDPIVVEDDDTDSGGDGTSKEQVGNHDSLGTSLTSGGGSEARYPNLHENSERDTPNTSPPYRNTLLSTPGKQTCGSKGGNCKGLRPDTLTGRDKKNLWNGQETEAGNKKEDEERHNTDGGKETIPSLGLTKERRPSAIEERSALKRYVKRRRYLSPEQDEAGSSQDNIKAQAEGWEIVDILGKRETVWGTQYKVRRRSTWLLEGELGNAQELLQEFEANGRARHGRKRVRLA
ncbi:hypothetical protein ABVK25_010166 [Lepraria finkii]|uniref:Uncharacterized protein n=1 Tax=Lepraria finkii TaxID=1340010 RepID=A0ABR4AV79_9LECA